MAILNIKLEGCTNECTGNATTGLICASNCTCERCYSQFCDWQEQQALNHGIRTGNPYL